MTVQQSLLFVDTDDSVEAVLNLLDSDSYASYLYVNEYPMLTALARTTNPSIKLLNTFKNYLMNKDSNFSYLRKLYLVYSTLVKNYCNDNACDATLLVII